MRVSRPYNNEIVMIEDFLSQEEADIFLKLATSDPELWEFSNDGSGLTEWYNNNLVFNQEKLKNSYSYYMGIIDSIQNRCRNIFTECYGIVSPEFIKIYNLSRRSGSGLNVHTDEIDPDHPQYNPEEKIITHGFVVYLNDDYEGGEIFYPNKNISIKPIARSLVMHPGNKEYEHGVTEVSGSTRYSLAWWTR